MGACGAASLQVTPGGTGQDFKYANGTIITDTSPHTIRLGYFSNYTQTGANDAPVVPDAFKNLLADPTIGIVSTITNYFIPIGEGRANLGPVKDWSIVALGGILLGKYSVNATLSDPALNFSADPANTVSANGVPRGSRIFIIAYNTEDYTRATEIGIFSGTSSTVGQWYVPTTTATSVTSNLGFIDNVGTTEVFRGSLGSLALAPVPEPTASILALGALGFLWRRRR